MSSNALVLEGKRVLVTGGTGSLGKAVVRRILTGEMGVPARIEVFSRDEGKHHQMRLDFAHMAAATDDIAYHNFERLLVFRIGDVRDYAAVKRAVHETDIVIHAAALKQVPSCEYFPYDAVRTNVEGAQNVVWAIREPGMTVERAVAISTDKACKPINVMGMSKAIQERIFVEGNLGQDSTSLFNVRYGNVVASRGSVVPLFEAQIANGGPVTITTTDMTRFLITLDGAVDTVFDALRTARPGETYVPQLPAVKVTELAAVMIGDRPIETVVTGIRPGEKVHEIMVSDEEAFRTIERGDYYVIEPMLPEVATVEVDKPALDGEYSSAHSVVPPERIPDILKAAGRFQDVVV
ncbi:MAG TPA: polysaccharide biosynthesis protein [Acidimicrobiales bacterium]|nr:polysaccharide biosynthesis protein [Acidimicrobiales bacterium]